MNISDFNYNMSLEEVMPESKMEVEDIEKLFYYFIRTHRIY